jgi:hypothetical protein
VTIERDPDAGARLGGYFLGSGLILGWASAGDWVSVADTWNDFYRIAVYLVPLALLAIVVEKWIQPQERPRTAPGPAAIAVGLTYALYGLLITFSIGPL